MKPNVYFVVRPGEKKTSDSVCIDSRIHGLHLEVPDGPKSIDGLRDEFDAVLTREKYPPRNTVVLVCLQGGANSPTVRP